MSKSAQTTMLRFVAIVATLAAIFTGSTAGVTLARSTVLQPDTGRVSISCQYSGSGNVAYQVSLENIPGSTPTSTVTITYTDGRTETRTITGTSFQLSGDIASVSVNTVWRDANNNIVATGYAEADCQQTNPTPTTGPTRTPRPTSTPGGPTRTPRPTRTPGPSPTPRPTRTPTVAPTSSTVGSIAITCDYFAERDRQFTVVLQERPGGAPNGTATLTLVDGGEEQRSFSDNRLVYRGPYLRLAIVATWPDGARGSASATCGLMTPTPVATETPVPSETATPTIVRTETAVPTATTPPDDEETPTATTPPSPQETPTATTPPDDEETPTATTPPSPQETPTPGVTETPTTPPVIETPTTPPVIETPTTPPVVETPTPTVQRQAVQGAEGEDEGQAPPSRPRTLLPSTGSSDATMLAILTLALLLIALGAHLRLRRLRQR